MKRFLLVVGTLVALLQATCFPIYAGPLDETRYCGSPQRGPDGELIRDAGVIREFKALHPKPASDLLPAPCNIWQVDHIIPLACGGCDAVSNLQWLPTCLKTTKVLGKDRWERKIYGGLVDGVNCGVPK